MIGNCIGYIHVHVHVQLYVYDEFSIIFATSIDVDECKEKQEENEEEDGSGVCEEGKYCFNIPGSFRCNGRWRDRTILAERGRDIG